MPTEHQPRGLDTVCAPQRNGVYTRYTKAPRGKKQGFEYHF